MSNIWIRELTGGLDSRKMPETSDGGSLVKAVNGHITRGGEFEKRAAFVPVATLPAGQTIGLIPGVKQLIVVGNGSAPAGLPPLFEYHSVPGYGSIAPQRVLSSQNFSGSPYFAVEYYDGSVWHWYKDARVNGLADCRAKCAINFTIAGSGTPIDVSAVTLGGINALAADVTAPTPVDAVAFARNMAQGINTGPLGAVYTAIPVIGGLAAGNYDYVLTWQTAAGETTPSNEVSVSAVGTSGANTLTFNAAPAGAVFGRIYRGIAPGGENTYFTIGVGGTTFVDSGAAGTPGLPPGVNTATLPNPTLTTVTTATTGGTLAAGTHYYKKVDVNAAGTTIGSNEVSVVTTGTTSANTITFPASNPGVVSSRIYHGTAAGAESTYYAITAAATSFVDTGAAGTAGTVPVSNTAVIAPGVMVSAASSATGGTVRLICNAPGASNNGVTVAVTGTGLTTTIDNSGVFGGGFDQATGLNPNYQSPFSATVFQNKIYGVENAILQFSALGDPSNWYTGTGKGFVDMSTQSQDSANFHATVQYQQYLAVVADRTIHIWYIDPDPSLNKLTQTLHNTGSRSPRSVVAFGDADVFYLDASGLRSLKARDASNAAITSDIGVAVDALFTAKMATMSLDQMQQYIIGVVEPTTGRFWLAMRDVIYVLSYYPGSKVSAWTQYTPSVMIGGVETPFLIDDMCVFQGRVYIRSGDTVYCYGGTGQTPVYDLTVPEMWMPYLDGGAPTRGKKWSGFDAACAGEWDVFYGFDPTNLNTSDQVGTVYKTTYGLSKIPAVGESTHVSVRMRGRLAIPSKIGAININYDGDADED